MIKQTIGQRLRGARMAKKLTQAQLAQKAGVSQGTIGNLESGVRKYGDSLVDIARALDVSPEYLRDGIEPASALPTGEPSSGGDAALTPRQIAILDLFGGLTIKQQDEFFKNLEGTKQANSELMEELSQRRRQ